MPSKPTTVKKAVKSIAKMGRTPTQPAAQLAEDCPRTVRPRQLHINDKIRLVYTANPASSGTEDAGLLEWLNSQDEQSSTAPGRTARVAVVGHTFKPIPAVLEAPELQHAAAAVKPSAAAQDNGPPIVTPSFVNVQTDQDQEGLNTAKSAYIRYVVPTPDDQEATVEYDLDEEDEDWLQEHNLRAKQKLSEDDLERLIDALEKMHHAEIQKHPEQWANLIGSPLMARGKGKGKGSSSQPLLLPEVDTVLPLHNALQALPDQQPAAVKAVYQHWCNKRCGSERPLLQRLWYEPPWHRLTVAGSKGSMKDATDADDDIVPFSGQDDRRPLRARKTMQLQNVDAVLRDMRGDLEQARILADQVQHREKLRKRALLSWQQNMRLLAARAATLDRQKAGSSPPTASKTQAASVKKALSSFEELARSEDGMRAKFEHDMALSLELTRTVAEEAGKLQHVKIVCAEPSQPDLAPDAASLDPRGSHQVQEATETLPAGVAGHTEASQQAADMPMAGSLQKTSQAALLQSSLRMTRSMLASLTDADQPADSDVVRRQGQTLSGPAWQPSPRLTRSMQTQPPQAEQQPTAPTSVARNPASGNTPATASEGQHQSPPSSHQLASPRLTRSRQTQLPDDAQEAAAKNIIARHPAAGIKADSMPKDSQQQTLQASLLLTSPRVTRSQQAQLAEPAQEPAALPSVASQSRAADTLPAESEDMRRAPDSSMQIASPRMTRFKQAQLADANASSAAPRSASGLQNNIRHSAPAGPEDSPQSASHTSPTAKDVSPVGTASLTAKSAAASHEISPRQTRSGLTFASFNHQLPGTTSDIGTPATLAQAEPQQHLHVPSNRQSSRQSDAGPGAKADVTTAGAESSTAPNSMPSSAQRQQSLSLSSGRPTKAHSHHKTKSVRWSLSLLGASPHHSATHLSPSPSPRQQPQPYTAQQQLAPPVCMQRTTVDRGCDPINFSDCNTSDSEPEVPRYPGKGTAKAHLPVQREQPMRGAAPSCQKCGQGKAKEAAGSASQSRGCKRRLEVSPLAGDTRRVSRRLNPEPTCVLPRTRAAAHATSTPQHSSASARAKQASSTPTQAVPIPVLSRAVKPSSELSRAKQTQTKQAVPRQTRQASAAKPVAAIQAKAPHVAQAPVPVASDAADVARRVAFRDAAVLKSRDASGKFIKGAPPMVDTNMARSSNDKKASASGQGKSGSARQAADRLAKQSAYGGKHSSSSRRGLQLAVAHLAAHAFQSRQQPLAKQGGPVASKRLARDAMAKSPTSHEDAGPAATAVRDTQRAGAVQSATATLDASSMQLLQQAVADKRLGCPKCRYAQLGCKKCRATFLKQNGGPAMPRSCMPNARTLGFAQPQAALQSAHKLTCLPASTDCAAAPAKSRQQERDKSNKAAAASDARQQAASPLPGNGRKRKEQQDAQQALVKKQKTGSQQQSGSQQQQLIQKGSKGSKAAGKQTSVPFRATSALQHQLPSSSKSATRSLQQKVVHQDGTPAARAQQQHACRTSSRNKSAADQRAASDRHRKLSVQNLPLAHQTTGHHRSSSARSSNAAKKPAAPDQLAAQHAKSSKPVTKLPVTASSAQQPSAKSVPAKSVPAKSAPANTAPANTAPVKTRKPSAASKTQPRKLSAARALSPVPMKAGKPLPAAKIKTSKAGLASAAGQAVAGVLDSKLGCSKCRYVPGGCTKCRAKQAGQLVATKPTAKRQ